MIDDFKIAAVFLISKRDSRKGKGHLQFDVWILISRERF